MADIVGIRFPSGGKTYCFKAEGMDLRLGDRVVVESELGISIGSIARTKCESDVPLETLKPVLRKLTEADIRQEEDNERVKAEAREFCTERIKSRELPMKLLTTDVTLDRKRFIFYFTADTRIDFRELVKDLASRFKTRIELRQIGVRDAAKIVGGFGICGKEICCKTWLKSFAPISIKMAKQQDLVLNTCKLSGLCGRLLCCLNYEYDKNKPSRPRPKKAGQIAVETEAAVPCNTEALQEDQVAEVLTGEVIEVVVAEAEGTEIRITELGADSAAAGLTEPRQARSDRTGDRTRHDRMRDNRRSGRDRGRSRPDAQPGTPGAEVREAVADASTAAAQPALSGAEAPGAERPSRSRRNRRRRDDRSRRPGGPGSQGGQGAQHTAGAPAGGASTGGAPAQGGTNAPAAPSQQGAADASGAGPRSGRPRRRRRNRKTSPKEPQ